jgi:hypothetical protein
MQVNGNMTVQNANLSWTSGTMDVGGNFVLKGSKNIKVPDNGQLIISGSLSILSNLSIKGFGGNGTGGVVSWGVEMSL